MGPGGDSGAGMGAGMGQWERDGAVTPQQQWGDVGPGWGSGALTPQQQWGGNGVMWGQEGTVGLGWGGDPIAAMG